MPKVGVTIYELLLSCPGDVIDLIDVVKDSVEDFNLLYGGINNIQIVVKHWSTNAYPESGGAAQELLNKQFIHDCDACVALLGNRFGSPTDRYESGTEEEIEDMIASNKQVFMYFIERQVDPATIDVDQLSKVRNFKEKYSNDSKGIYWTIKDSNELRKLFLNHLGLHFLKLLAEPTTVAVDKKLPNLEILINGNIKEHHTEYQRCKLLYEKESQISKKIEKIKNILLPDENTQSLIAIDEKTLPEIDNDFKDASTYLRDLMNKTKREYRTAVIPDYEKEEIITYCEQKNIEISNEFWNLGNLQIEFKLMLYDSNDKENYKGSDLAYDKYNLIEKLWLEISEYNDYINFFAPIDLYSYINFYIGNTGTSFDEDIDVKIKIPKGCIVKPKDFVVPGEACIKEIITALEILFKGERNADIEEYSDYPFNPLSQYENLLPFNGLRPPTASQIYEREKKEFNRKLEDIFCYEYYEDGSMDILAFNIKYLKQKMNMYFPSILFFSQMPKNIEYDIRSKHYPDVVSGKIEIGI